MKKLILVSLIAMATSGCVSTKSENAMSKTVEMPARIQGMQDAHSVAVVSVKRESNRYGDHDVVASRLEAFLANINVKGQQYFNVVDRQTMDKVMSEQRLSAKHTFDQQTSAKLGRLVGADTLMTATYGVKNDANKYSKKASRCTKERDSNGHIGKALDMKSCEQSVDVTVSCLKRTSRVQFTPKATAVGTGHVIYAKTYKAEAQSSRCDNGRDDALDSFDQLEARAFEIVFDHMRQDIAPYMITLDLDIMKKDNSQMPVETKALFDEGLYFVKESLYDRACAKFSKSAETFKSPAIIYNIGVCHDLKGQRDNALAYYNQALDMSSMMDSKGKKMVTKAIRRNESDTIEVEESNDSILDLAKDFGSSLFELD